MLLNARSVKIGIFLLAVSLFTSSAIWGATVTEVAADPSTIQTITYPGIRAGLILILFLIIASTIALRKIPAMLALPLMALGIGMAAGVPFLGESGILQAILEGKSAGNSPTGSFQLYKPIIWVLFGGIFARFISDARIAEKIVKYAAELGGENPFNISLIMAVITIVIFTAAGGLPMIIMLGTVMFPILLSLGVPAVVCGSLLLLAFPIGNCLSPAQWAGTSELFNVPVEQVKRYFLIWAGIQSVVLLTFLTIEFLRSKRLNISKGSIIRSLSGLLLCLAVIGAAALIISFRQQFPPFVSNFINKVEAIKSPVFDAVKIAIWILLISGILIVQYFYHFKKQTLSGWNLITPLLPLIFLLFLDFGTAFIPAFMTAVAYGVLTTPQPKTLQKLGRTIINGVNDVSAPIILMVGIGMLIASATHPTVETLLTPVLEPIIPTTRWGFVAFFIIAAPLSLYRGPLNIFGLGVGLARLMQKFMPNGATMGALQSVSMLQDPTTTQNVWVCGYLKLDINAILFKLFVYSVFLVIAGLILSAIMFYS